MNIISPSKTFRNCMANENSRMENMETNAELEFKKNMNFLLFHNSIQNFLRLDNSTEEIKIDLNVFLHQTSVKELEINLNSNKIFFSDINFLEMQFEKIYLKSYSSIFENYIKIFKNLNHCNNCQKLFKINGSCKCISEEGSLAIINFTENFICILNFMNYKEKIFNEIMLDLKKKKIQLHININNSTNRNEFESNHESAANIVNLLPIYNSDIPSHNAFIGNVLDKIKTKKTDNYLFNNLIVKYNSEISIILKFFLKCLLNNYKCDDSQIRQTCIKPEIKELILRCKLAKTVETFISLIIKDEIKFEIDIISGFYDKPYLEELYKIIDNHYILWIKNNLCCNPKDIISKTKTIKDEIIEYLHKEYIKVRVDNFFEVIKAYPDSSPILSDVRKSIGSIQQNELIQKIKSQIEKRLLNQGIATSLIIEIFIRLINIMKFIDTSSILLEIISNPIKHYLRSRKDTLRCIINLIINEEDLSLKTEIENNQSTAARKKINYKNITNVTSYNLIENLSSDEDEAEAEKWEPLALEISKNQKINIKNKFADIISTLVFIFGSPEEFVEHYKRMLAERSVSDEMSKFSIETEIKNLELLKVKFGENYFQSCEVLIKDVKDSIKLNKTLQQQTELITQNKDFIYSKKDFAEKDPNFNIMVISNAYWPFKKTKIYIIDEANFEEDPLSSTYTNIAHMNPHTQKAIEQRKKNIKEFLLRIKNKQEIFKKAYSQIKTSRTLDFFSNVGFVDLDLSFENGTFVFRVTPLSALIIQLFDEEILSMTLGENNSPKKLENQDYSIFTVEFIMEIFAATEAEVRKRINFWVSKGVLRDYSLDPNNYAESSFYVPNDVLPGSFFSANENDGIIFEDEIFNFEFVSLNENKLNLENAVTTILKNSGPKNFEQLLKKLVVSLQVNISEIMLKEILGKLTLDQKIFKEGELFNILVTSN